jgi:hypothetical protein
MPNGVVLNLDRYEVTHKEQGLVRFVAGGAEVTLKGNAVPFGKPDLTDRGYMFTRVPAEFWDAWLATHADSPLLADGLIIVAKTAEAGRQIAKEREKEPGQFERLREDDPRTRALGVTKYDPKDEAA